jgi:hypothetical protein
MKRLLILLNLLLLIGVSSIDAQNYKFISSIDEDMEEHILEEPIYIDFAYPEIHIYKKDGRLSFYRITDISTDELDGEEVKSYIFHPIRQEDKYYSMSVYRNTRGKVIMSLYDGEDTIVLRGYKH